MKFFSSGFLSLLLVSFLFSPSFGQHPELKMGMTIEKEIQKEEKHNYTVRLKANQFFLAHLNQKGIDLIIEAYDPDGEKIGSFDSPNANKGIEPITMTTKRKGNYRLEVRPLNENENSAEKGNYSLKILRMERQATTPGGKVDQLFAAWDRDDTPGATVAVVKEGQVVYSNGYGSANLEYGIPNRPATIFHIASVSKQFTAFAIAQLAEEGKLSWDDDIRKHLPEVPDFGEKITIRHLVHHTSGLRDQWNLLVMAGWRMDDVITKEQVLTLVEKQQDLNFSPGEEYMYCNTGFTLMGEIVARVSGQTFAEWSQTHIFQPLGMSHTLFYDDHEKIVQNRAYSYRQDGSGFKKAVLSYANVGATSLFTTVEDLGKWAVNFETMKVGNQTVMDQIHQRGILNNGDTIPYAFGQVIGTYKGLPTVSHGGADAGYRTFFVRFPEQRAAVIVFSNLASFNPGGLAYQVADIHLEDEFEVEESSADMAEGEMADAEDEAFEVNPDQLETYVGKYELAPGFIITIRIEENKLMGQATGQPSFELKPTAEHAFAVQGVEAHVSFQQNDKGIFDQLTFNQGGQEMKAPKMETFDTKSVNLEEFAGTYYSEELGTSYVFEIEEDNLIATHVRHTDFMLTPSKKDYFSGDAWFFGQVEFTRNRVGDITGCKVSNGRVRNLFFTKAK